MMKRLDDDPDEQYLKIGLTGDSGAGKTWLGATAPKPLILIWERQAKASLEACCAARGLPKPMMILIETISDCGNVLRALHGDRTKPCVVRERYYDPKTKTNRVRDVMTLPHWPETLVTDSLTDACAMMRAELLREAPPKVDAESGLPDESFAHRRTIFDRCSQLIRAFRNVPAHVVFLCLKIEKKIYRGKKEVGRRWVADLPDNKLPAAYMAACNIVGVPYIRKGHRGVILDADDWMGCKAFPSLRSFEVPELSEWIGRIQGTWEGGASAAPPVSEDAEDGGMRDPEPEKEADAGDADASGVDGAADAGDAGAADAGEPDLSFGFEAGLPPAEKPAEGAAADNAVADTPEPETAPAKRSITCGHCKESGHNRRSCPLLQEPPDEVDTEGGGGDAPSDDASEGASGEQQSLT